MVAQNDGTSQALTEICFSMNFSWFDACGLHIGVKKGLYMVN